MNHLFLFPPSALNNAVRISDPGEEGLEKTKTFDSQLQHITSKQSFEDPSVIEYSSYSLILHRRSLSYSTTSLFPSSPHLASCTQQNWTDHQNVTGSLVR